MEEIFKVVFGDRHRAYMYYKGPTDFLSYIDENRLKKLLNAYEKLKDQSN